LTSKNVCFLRNWLKVEEEIIRNPWKTRQIKGAMELENCKLFERLKLGEKPEKVLHLHVGSAPVKQNTEGDQAASDAAESK
jgi:hypothetical protein